jgi:hypothetical protein
MLIKFSLLPVVFVLFVISLSIDCIYSGLQLESDTESISLLRIPIECNWNAVALSPCCFISGLSMMCDVSSAFSKNIVKKVIVNLNPVQKFRLRLIDDVITDLQNTGIFR